ncbi:hypothetical protein [Saccharopolyspora phatthalungensis]|uniref:Uncharacterized protein n=1 Tax=Saccharopolyspora phatthalungensis TaxID=664693 RepID=A0A840QG29_9PSEU|nr:hypothetical protein [Saccharopolyspora phatthalungensis]MBB5157698.1 hypothetical protein [Saccharopolyspora phatthalungensis]
MARVGDRNVSAEGFSGIISRIDPFCWIPVVPMLVLALVTTLIGVPGLGLTMLIFALVILAFDIGVNSRRKSAARRQPPRRPRYDDLDDRDLEPRRRAPAQRPARPAAPERAAAPRNGGAPSGAPRNNAARNGATRAVNQPRRNPGGQRPAGGRPGAPGARR